MTTTVSNPPSLTGSRSSAYSEGVQHQAAGQTGVQQWACASAGSGQKSPQHPKLGRLPLPPEVDSGAAACALEVGLQGSV